MNARRAARALAGSVAGALLALTALGAAAPADAATHAAKGHGGVTATDTGWGYL